MLQIVTPDRIETIDLFEVQHGKSECLRVIDIMQTETLLEVVA
jgi:hypothetical protein